MTKIQVYKNCFRLCSIVCMVSFLGTGFLSYGFNGVPAEMNEDERQTEKFFYNDEGMSDPFLPLLSKASAEQAASGRTSEEKLLANLQKIEVIGILWEEKNPVVIINAKMYKEGETVEDLTIRKINPSSVVFSYKGLWHIISMIEK